jgi:hypothetical protein
MKSLFLISSFLLGACTFAQAQFAGGTGTESDPWQITTLAQLNAIRDNQGTSSSQVFYKLMNNLVFTASDDLNGEKPGNLDPLPLIYGSFDGNGKTVTGVVIEQTADYTGFFSQMVYGGYVRNLGLINCNIKGTYRVGGIAGNCDGEITACFVTGTIAATGNNVGGIAGYFSGSINACYNAATVNASSSQYVGGIAGYASYGCINTCYNTGIVSGSKNVSAILGYGSYSTMINCFYLAGTASAGTGSAVLSETEMKAPGFLDSLNEPFFINYWKAGGSENNGFPIHAWQNNGTIDRRGETAANPFPITNLQELNKMRDYIQMYRYFKLMNDLNFGVTDLNAANPGNFDPIGNGSLNSGLPFHGEFDGNNKKITGLQTERIYYSGLFGNMKGIVKNLTLENASIKGTAYIGGIAGYFTGSIENCLFSGTVSGDREVGGLVGQAWWFDNIKNCTNKGAVTGSNSVGGIAGTALHSNTNPSSMIEACANEGNINGITTDNGNTIGGLVGFLQSAIMRDCRGWYCCERHFRRFRPHRLNR